MNGFSGRKEPAIAGSFRRVSPRTRLAIAGCGLAVLIAAAAAAQRSDDQRVPAAAATIPIAAVPAIPRLRLPWPWRPAAAWNAPPRDPFAFAEATATRLERPSTAAAVSAGPADIGPVPPPVPQLIGILSDASPDGPRYRAVLITAAGDLWFAGEGDSRDGFTVRHLTEQSVDVAASEAAAVAHLTLP